MKTTLTVLLTLFAILLCPPATAQEWSTAPERSGVRLPPPRTISMYVGADGAYVPRIGDISTGDTWVLMGNLLWNFALVEKFGLFGSHRFGYMHWGPAELTLIGNETGLRFRPLPILSFEAVYLAHRVDVTWVEDVKFFPGGVVDHGAEVGTWLDLSPFRRIRLGFHLYGRYFSVYTEDQLVLGTTAKFRMLPADGHELVLSVDFLEVWRVNARSGVEEFTHNTIGNITWKSNITPRFGILLRLMVSQNLLVGEMPMLELKRSMIGEPMGLGTVGIFARF